MLKEYYHKISTAPFQKGTRHCLQKRRPNYLLTLTTFKSTKDRRSDWTSQLPAVGPGRELWALVQRSRKSKGGHKACYQGTRHDRLPAGTKLAMPLPGAQPSTKKK